MEGLLGHEYGFHSCLSSIATCTDHASVVWCLNKSERTLSKNIKKPIKDLRERKNNEQYLEPAQTSSGGEDDC